MTFVTAALIQRLTLSAASIGASDRVRAHGDPTYPVTLEFWVRWILIVVVITAAFLMWDKSRSLSLLMVTLALNSGVYFLAFITPIVAFSTAGEQIGLRIREAVSVGVPLLQAALLVTFFVVLHQHRGFGPVRPIPECQKCRIPLTAGCQECPRCGMAIEVVSLYRVELQ